MTTKQNKIKEQLKKIDITKFKYYWVMEDLDHEVMVVDIDLIRELVKNQNKLVDYLNKQNEK